MWQVILESIKQDRVLKLSIGQDGKRLTHAEVIEGWRSSEDFRRFYLEQLAGAPFPAFFWEAPPLTSATVNQAYECVLVDSPQLAGMRPDTASFADYFKDAGAGRKVVVFENLGKDAVLVVPCPDAPPSVYTHFAAFVRGAPEGQRHELLCRLAQAIDSGLSDKPLWVSTSGLGVYWLHVRLDTRPKYYTYRPYAILERE